MRILRHNSLSRRALLKGTGAAVALPWLEAMTQARGGSDNLSPRRIVFLYVPNGIIMNNGRRRAQARDMNFRPRQGPLGTVS